MNMMFGCRKKSQKKDVCKIQEDLILEHMQKLNDKKAKKKKKEIEE